MGASTSFRKYKADLGLTEIKRLWAEAVEQSLYEDGHSYSGEIGMLGRQVGSWHDNDLDGSANAYTYIEDRHQKWNPAIAVSYLDKGVKYWLIGGWCSS